MSSLAGSGSTILEICKLKLRIASLHVAGGCLWQNSMTFPHLILCIPEHAKMAMSFVIHQEKQKKFLGFAMCMSIQPFGHDKGHELQPYLSCRLQAIWRRVPTMDQAAASSQHPVASSLTAVRAAERMPVPECKSAAPSVHAKVCCEVWTCKGYSSSAIFPAWLPKSQG